ncbi:MAG: molybdate transporter, ATPase subunit [Gemmataceae bacterium]|nr:molybdate transporter, ATPase subunit [Gemmataceae bacterium]
MTTDLVARFVKRFRGGPVVAADLAGGGVTALFGPSGCGKTTTLRCLAGLDRPDDGEIRLGGELWFDAARRVCLRPQQRGVGFLFQDYALFPHLTVGGNVAFGLAGLPRADRLRRAADALDRLGIGGLEGRYPHQVSGGQQQRVALARVLVCRPRLLLLDEPLVALDAPTRDALRPELRRLLASISVPVVLVTHDRAEAAALADQVVVLDHGAVVQRGTTADVFARPAGLTAARIVGVETVHPGRVLRAAEGLAVVAVGRAEVVAVAPVEGPRDVYACVRGEDVILLAGGDGHMVASARNQLSAVVTAVTPEGPLVRVGLDAGFLLTALVTRPAADELGLAVGTRVTALVKAQAVHLIPRPVNDPVS